MTGLRRWTREEIADSLARPALSPRQIQILQLLAAGHNDQRIADALFISVSTLKSHCATIYDKLGTRNRNRTQAVAIGYELGLLVKGDAHRRLP